MTKQPSISAPGGESVAPNSAPSSGDIVQPSLGAPVDAAVNPIAAVPTIADAIAHTVIAAAEDEAEAPRSRKLRDFFRADEYLSRPIDPAPVDLAAGKGRDVEKLRIILVNLLEVDHYPELEIPIVQDFLAQLFDLHEIGEKHSRMGSFYLERYLRLVEACRERYVRTPAENSDFAGFLDGLVEKIKATLRNELTDEQIQTRGAESLKRLDVLIRLAEQTGVLEENDELKESASKRKNENVLKYFRELLALEDTMVGDNWNLEKVNELVEAAVNYGVELPLAEAQQAADEHIAFIERKIAEAETMGTDDADFNKKIDKIYRDFKKHMQVVYRASCFPGVVIKSGEREMPVGQLRDEFEKRLNEIEKKPIVQEFDKKIAEIKAAMPGRVDTLLRLINDLFGKTNWNGVERLGLQEYAEQQLRELVDENLTQEITKAASALAAASAFDERENLIRRLQGLTAAGRAILDRRVGQ